MASKVNSIIIEDEVPFLTGLDVEFVSLVRHAANQQPFKIIKGQVKGDSSMRKVIQNVLIPKDLEEDTVKELAEAYEISVEEKAEDVLEGYNVYKQVDDAEVVEDSRELAALDKEKGVYCVVADLTETSEETPTEKQYDMETMWDFQDAALSMLDIVLGAVSQPEADAENRKAMIMSAVDNFKNFAEAFFSQSKAASETIDLEQVEVKQENLQKLFKHEVEPAVEETDDMEEIKSELEALKEVVEQKAEEKAEEKINAFKEEFETMRADLNESLNKHLEGFSKKEEMDESVKTLKSELDELKNTTQSRKGEVDDHVEPEKRQKRSKSRTGYVTFV